LTDDSFQNAGGLDFKLLAIYLNDHLAGATGGLELARRAAGNNRDNEFGPFLEGLALQIEEDRTSLIDAMQRLGVPRDRVKVVLGWAAEKAGRLKLNGHWTSYSPLSRLLELETLLIGVRAKLALWETLAGLSSADPRLGGLDLAGLAARARAQQDALEGRRVEAAALALSRHAEEHGER
jgi:hypothetical protein